MEPPKENEHGASSGLDDPPCSRVVAVSRLIELAENLERWGEARFAERQAAQKEGKEMAHHRDNYYCGCGQVDAADRLRDLIRNESFSENKQNRHP